MNRLPRRMLFMLLAAAVALVAVQPAAASTPISAAGTFFFTAAPVVSDFRAAGRNTFVTASFPGVLTGDITGTFTEQLQVVTHADGSQNVKGNATCSCAVAGRAGTLVFDNIVGTANASGVSEAHYVLSGSGGLADLHGQGTAIVSPTPQGLVGVYTARYSFDP